VSQSVSQLQSLAVGCLSLSARHPPSYVPVSIVTNKALNFRQQYTVSGDSSRYKEIPQYGLPEIIPLENRSITVRLVYFSYYA
jgi:hypothetical protein